MSRLDWAPILRRAAEIVRSYDTSVTLRQLFYRLVSEQLLPNTDTTYKTLSAKTAELRRAGVFPALMDRNRSIYRDQYFTGALDALDAVIGWFRLDRTTGQDVSLYLGFPLPIRQGNGKPSTPVLDQSLAIATSRQSFPRPIGQGNGKPLDIDTIGGAAFPVLPQTSVT